MNDTGPIVVVGAGPAGIGAGLALGNQAIVLEPRPRVAGLCRTIHLDGAVFDHGGHSFHTPHSEIRQLVFDALPMFEQTRRAVCYSHGVLVPYPFQAHFGHLPNTEVVRECRQGLSEVNGAANARTFPEHVVSRFGAGIAQHFLLPYNRKLWGADLDRLAIDWVAERVAGPHATGSRGVGKDGHREPLQAEAAVAYPARGGFEEIWLALARRLHNLRLGQTVVHIDPRRRQLRTQAGDIIPWSRLVSTVPIDRLLAMIADVPPTLLAAASRLEALAVALVLVVTTARIESTVQRVYCAGPEIPAHKIVLNHNSSAYLRSLPRHGIMAEVSEPAGGRRPSGDLIAEVLRGLVAMGLLESPATVRTTRVIRVARAYPVPTRERDGIVGQLKAWLAERGIHSVGRFGEWAYVNADEALHRGLVLGRRLVHHAPDRHFVRAG